MLRGSLLFSPDHPRVTVEKKEYHDKKLWILLQEKTGELWQYKKNKWPGSVPGRLAQAC
jgi:hypothetical protein